MSLASVVGGGREWCGCSVPSGVASLISGDTSRLMDMEYNTRMEQHPH